MKPSFLDRPLSARLSGWKSGWTETISEGLRPLRGPTASRKAENSIDNIVARRKHEPTGALEAVVSV